MLQELIIHIGFHKTGTSSIQFFLHRNKNKLLKELGIYYPNTYIGESHNLYSYNLINFFPPMAPDEIKIGKEKLIKNFSQELSNVNPKAVLMSAEDFLFSIDDIYDLVRISEPKKLKIIVYFRRQDKMLESLHNESIKNLASVDFFSLCAFYIWYFHGRIFLNYYNFLKHLEDIFKAEITEIFPRIYFKDINKNWDAVEDFCSLLGISKSAFTEEKVEANVSLSPTSTEALNRIKRKYLLPLKTFNRVVGFLYKYDSQHPSRIKTLMPLEIRKKILECYKESNEKLFKEYFNQEKLFVLSKEEEEFYKEQESIPKDEIEKEIEEKYRSILEFIKKENFLTRTKIFTNQVFGHSELTKEFIRCGLITDWVGGHVGVCNEEKIAGWLLDLKDKEPCFLVKLNEIVVHVGIPSLERVDIKDIYGIDWYAGFSVFWKDVKLPEQILSLPDDAEIEVEVIHEKKGYIIPGNYKKILKKDLIAKIKECEKPKAEIRQILTLGSKKLIYIYQTVTKPASEALFTQTDITDILITYIPDNHDWNLICIAPKDTTSIPLVIKYLDGSEEKIEVKI